MIGLMDHSRRTSATDVYNVAFWIKYGLIIFLQHCCKYAFLMASVKNTRWLVQSYLLVQVFKLVPKFIVFSWWSCLVLASCGQTEDRYRNGSWWPRWPLAPDDWFHTAESAQWHTAMGHMQRQSENTEKTNLIFIKSKLKKTARLCPPAAKCWSLTSAQPNTEVITRHTPPEVSSISSNPSEASCIAAAEMNNHSSQFSTLFLTHDEDKHHKPGHTKGEMSTNRTDSSKVNPLSNPIRWNWS